MVALTWSRLVVAVLVLVGIGALACWRAYRLGFEERTRYDYDRGWRDGAADARKEEWLREERRKGERIIAIAANRSAGARKGWAKRKGEA